MEVCRMKNSVRIAAAAKDFTCGSTFQTPAGTQYWHETGYNLIGIVNWRI